MTSMKAALGEMLDEVSRRRASDRAEARLLAKAAVAGHLRTGPNR
jgi:hypothetical protein